MDTRVFVFFFNLVGLALSDNQTALYEEQQIDFSWPSVRFVCFPHLNAKTNKVGVPVGNFR